MALGAAHAQTQTFLAQTIIANSLSHMEFDDSSMISTPPEKEPVMEHSLLLTTLSGETFQVSLSVAKFDRFEDLEEQVMDYLVSVTDFKVFGCCIDFLQTATQTYLEDPIWEKLHQGMEYTIVFRNCSVILPSQVELEDCPIRHIPLAVHVPMNPERSVPEGAFAGVPRLRHVSVESGIRFIKAEAWQNCRQLRIVKLPATVVGISDNVFRDCKLLNSVAAPGCLDFGYKAFAECCSLQWVYASEGIANVFNSEAKLGQYLFQGCINLAEVTLSELPSPRESALQARVSELTPGCLSSTGITALALPMHFVTLGAHARDSCRLLKNIDLSNTQVEEIPEFAFVHCTSLKEVLLPTTLHTIRVKAFMNCAALVELAIPPSLRYIGSRAFLDCTVFSRLVKMPGRHKWRGVYAEENAFAICPAMRWPPWLHMIPDRGHAPGLR